MLFIILQHAFQRQHQTPLHWAVEYNHMDLVELMLLSGADVNRKNEVKEYTDM